MSTSRRGMTSRLGVTAAALAALSVGLVGPASAALTTEPTANKQVRSGNLDWGFKQSFREYVEGPIAGGGIDVTDPASRLADGTFRWTQGSGRVNPATDKAKLAFEGEVYFYGHAAGPGWALEVWLEQPRLKLNGDTGVLIGDVTSRSLSTGDIVFYDDVELAELDLTGKSLDPNDRNVVRVSDIPATITAEGGEAFAGFYAEGEALDPVAFRVKLRA